MRRLAVTFMLLATNAVAQEKGAMVQIFTVPDAPRGALAAALEVRVGPLAPGQRVRLTTSDGHLIGTIAPFGAMARRNPGVYTLPIPQSMLQSGTLSASVSITEANKPPRAPTETEVQNVKLVAPGTHD